MWNASEVRVIAPVLTPTITSTIAYDNDTNSRYGKYSISQKNGNRNHINSAANDHLVGANLVLNFLYLLTVTFHSKDDAKKNVGSPHC